MFNPQKAFLILSYFLWILISISHLFHSLWYRYISYEFYILQMFSWLLKLHKCTETLLCDAKKNKTMTTKPWCLLRFWSSDSAMVESVIIHQLFITLAVMCISQDYDVSHRLFFCIAWAILCLLYLFVLYHTYVLIVLPYLLYFCWVKNTIIVLQMKELSWRVVHKLQ
jgi:hypothetical protein